MGLLDDAKGMQTRRLTCQAGVFLAGRDDIDEWLEVLASADVTAPTIAKLSDRFGGGVSSASWQRHRRGECSCGK